MNAKLGSTETLEITFFLLISSDLYHKKMLLESLNIPLSLMANLMIGLMASPGVWTINVQKIFIC